MKTRGQISNEIYAIIYGKDIRVLHKTMNKYFPKAKRCLDKLDLEDLELLIPILREEYEKHEGKQNSEMPLAVGGEQ